MKVGKTILYGQFIILFWIGLYAAGCTTIPNPVAPPQPNIILLYADDLGWKDLSIQGSDYYQTPNIDRLATEGVRFTNAYANAPNCAPSRASLMTGMYTPRHGIYTVNSSSRGKSIHRRLIPIENTTTLDSGFQVLPEKLKELGYNTAIAGKWHLSDDPTRYGFDTNFGGCHKGHPPSYFSPYKNPNLVDGPEGEYLPERLTKDVINWIGGQEDPFFLYFPFYLVHTPNQPKLTIEAKYAKLPPGEINGKPDYAAMVEAMDNSVGAILDKIKLMGKDKETIVVFTSDNGAYGYNSMSTPLRGGKGMLYEGGIRVPFIVRWPDHTVANTINTSPIIGTDLLPTFLTIAGSSKDSDIQDGIDLTTVFEGKPLDPRPLFWHFPAYLQGGPTDRAMAESHDTPYFRTTPVSAIREGDWKMIRYYETEERELFNLKEDISESKNLADIETAQLQKMDDRLNKWLRDINAPIPSELNPEYELSSLE